MRPLKFQPKNKTLLFSQKHLLPTLDKTRSAASQSTLAQDAIVSLRQPQKIIEKTQFLDFLSFCYCKYGNITVITVTVICNCETGFEAGRSGLMRRNGPDHLASEAERSVLMKTNGPDRLASEAEWSGFMKPNQLHEAKCTRAFDFIRSQNTWLLKPSVPEHLAS